MATVTFEGVNKNYGDFHAVKDLNLDIGDGEFMVLVGPSGCGKTTSLRMIAGLEEITSGTLRIGDRVVNDVPPKDRDIAMVFQNYALYPHMTVFENMAFGLKLRKVAKDVISQKVEKAAKILGIEKMLDRKPKALSGGQRQRVALGRAIVRDPKCFLFDEPLSNLDAKLRVEMRGELRDLHETLHSTTVYVTHDQEEAMTLGDRVVVMKDGIAQQVGSASEIYHNPANRFVAGFLGSPSMNFLEGRLVKEGDRLYFDEGSGKLPVPSAAAQRLEPHVGREVVLGVRPELLSDNQHAHFKTNGNALQMTVRQVQMLGDCLHVYLATDKHKNLVASVDGYAQFRAKDTVPIYVDMSRSLFFDASGDGARLSGPVA